MRIDHFQSPNFFCSSLSNPPPKFHTSIFNISTPALKIGSSVPYFFSAYVNCSNTGCTWFSILFVASFMHDTSNCLVGNVCSLFLESRWKWIYGRSKFPYTLNFILMWQSIFSHWSHLFTILFLWNKKLLLKLTISLCPYVTWGTFVILIKNLY